MISSPVFFWDDFASAGMGLLRRQPPYCQKPHTGKIIVKSAGLFCSFTNLVRIDHIVKYFRLFLILRIYREKMFFHFIGHRTDAVKQIITTAVKLRRVTCFLIINMYKACFYIR